MSEHVIDRLGAYHDGELRGVWLRQVETHLHECAACRAELEALEGLAAMLQENPAMPARTAPERFVAQVRLRLPPVSPLAEARALKAGWLLLPLGLAAMWAFLQAVLVVSGLVLLALPLVSGRFPGDVTAGLVALDTGLTIVLATLVWGWLAGWWAARQKYVRSSGESAG